MNIVEIGHVKAQKLTIAELGARARALYEGWRAEGLTWRQIGGLLVDFGVHAQHGARRRNHPAAIRRGIARRGGERGVTIVSDGIVVAERKLAAYPEADVIAALDLCQNEITGRLRMADVMERLPRWPTGSLDDYERGYRDGLFGLEHPESEPPERATGYAAGVKARLALAPPPQRRRITSSPRRVGTFKRLENPRRRRSPFFCRRRRPRRANRQSRSRPSRKARTTHSISRRSSEGHWRRSPPTADAALPEGAPSGSVHGRRRRPGRGER